MSKRHDNMVKQIIQDILSRMDGLSQETKDAVKACNAITLDEFEQMGIQRIKELYGEEEMSEPTENTKEFESEKDLQKIFSETRILRDRHTGKLWTDLGKEYDSHKWYTVDEMEAIIEHSFTIEEKDFIDVDALIDYEDKVGNILCRVVGGPRDKDTE